MKHVLNAALGGKSVIIPTHRVKYVFSEHTLLANDNVGVCVTENMTNMKRA